MEQLTLRKLGPEDYHKGYLDLLAQLTLVGTISFDDFERRLRELSHDYHIYVLEDNSTHRVVATGTLLVQKKIIRELGKVAHIEDVVVDEHYRGRHLGLKILNMLKEQGRRLGCYKAILDCSAHNQGFYEKAGFKPKQIQMAHYY